MTEKKYNLIGKTFIVTIVVILLTIIFISYEAIKETENYKLFTLDFKNKNYVISAYGNILGPLLAFISILSVLFNMISQRRDNTKKEEYVEREKISSYKDKLQVITIFLKNMIITNEEQFKNFQLFVENERENTFKNNNLLGFISNNYPKLILEEDKHFIYKALKHFKPTNDWKKAYTDILRLSEFYSRVNPELEKKHNNYIVKKYKLSCTILEQIDRFSYMISTSRNNMIENKTIDNPKFIFMDNIHVIIMELHGQRNKMTFEKIKEIGDPSSIGAWKSKILSPFSEQAKKFLNTNGLDPHINEFLKACQEILRNIHILEIDSLNYFNHIDKYSNKYYSPECTSIKSLKEIEKELDNID